MSDREELIEEAAKAIRGADTEMPEITPRLIAGWAAGLTDEETRARCIRQARAAFAVFEKAHSPTDDEREMLVREVSLAHAAAWSDERECAEAPDRIADAVLATGFRRTVQGEPTKAQVEAAAGMLIHTVGLCGDDVGCWCEEAQDKAWTVARAVLRVALRAAGVVTEQGGKP